ncbi:energy transducer TonB [Phenylobacterium sp. LjRoot164]|uniref:TonB family protein n=1 Tax=unclassified Phenylobacterium TaxID=2640670 RepID=UPI003ECF2719
MTLVWKMLTALVLAAAPIAAVADEPLAVRFAEPKDGYRQLGPVGPYYPQVAAQQRVTGSALIECEVGKKSVLRRCKVVDEAPKGAFFGAAALRMAQTNWISADPATPVGARARFQVPFALPEAR